MKACITLLIAMLLPLCAQQPEPAAIAAIAGNAHAFSLFHLLRQATEDNFCFSPFSSHQVACMLADGSAADTQAELLKLVYLPADETRRLTYLQALRSEIQSSTDQGKLQLGIANSIWAPESLPFAPSFQKLAEKSYEAMTGVIPANDPVQSAATINGWVRQRTSGKITNLVGPSLFSANQPSVVLVNAVYLKSKWAKVFDPLKTKHRPFHLSTGSATALPTMTKVENSLYSEGEGWQCLAMPFESNAISFHVLLPKDEATRKKTEASLSLETWEALLTTMTQHKVTSFLPRFSYSTQLSLKPLWQALGTQSVFTNGKAELPKMVQNQHCFITDVIHQATIEVLELGAEASAATVAAADPFGSAPNSQQKNVLFRADRPFLWFISHKKTGLILFMGRYAGK